MRVELELYSMCVEGAAGHKYQPLGMQARDWEVFLDDRCSSDSDSEGFN